MQLLIAIRNLRQAGRRTTLIALAIAIVTALLVVLSALSQGVSDNLIRGATTLAAGHVNVAGFYKTGTANASPVVTDVDEIRRIIVEETPELDYVIDRQRGWAKLVSVTESAYSGVWGVDAEAEGRFFETIQLAPESAYRENGKEEVLGDPARLSRPRTALLFESQAKRLEVTVGDVLTLRAETSRGVANTIDVTVVAVARDVGLLSNFSVFVNKETLRSLYQLRPETTGAFQLYLRDIDDANTVMSRLRTALREAGYRVMDHQPQPFYMKFEQVASEDWTGQKLDLTTWRDEVSFLTWILTALDTISLTLIAILIAIIAIGIMNTMLIAVRERTREIGTMRAMGMQRGAVLRLFLLEALLLGLGATVAGAVVGSLAAIGIDALEIEIPMEAMRAILMSNVLHLSVDLAGVARSIGILTFFTALSALWPALRAARMQPVDAMHKVG